MFLETCPFLQSFPICWHVIVILFVWFLVFLWYWWLFLLFHFLYCLVRSSLFSSCLPFQSTSSWFIDFFLLLFKSLFYFLSDLYYFLPSADFGFCLFFFFQFFSVVGLVVYLRFFLVFEESLYHYELPSKNLSLVLLMAILAST